MTRTNRHLDLAPCERDIFDILCVALEPMTRTNICRLASRLDLVDQDGKRLNSKNALPILTSLTHKGLIREERAFTVAPGLSRAATLALLELALLDPIDSGRYARFADAIREVFPLAEEPGCDGRAARELRHYALLGHAGLFLATLEKVQKTFGMRPRLLTGLTLPVDKAWLKDRPAAIRLEVLAQILDHAALELQAADMAFELFAGELADLPNAPPHQVAILTEQLLLRGRAREAQEVACVMAQPASRGMLAAALGQRGQAIAAFGEAEKLMRGSKRRKALLPSFGGLLQTLVLATSTDPAHQEEAAAVCERGVDEDDELSEAYRALERLLDFRRDRPGFDLYRGRFRSARQELPPPLVALTCALVERWTTGKLSSETSRWIEILGRRADEAGFTWLGDELLGRTPEPVGAERPPSLASLFAPKPAWERRLEAVLAAVPEPVQPPKETGLAQTKGQRARLVWYVDPGRVWLSIEPREQVPRGSGWTKGRKVALRRLYERDPAIDYLDAHDLRVCATALIIVPPAKH